MSKSVAFFDFDRTLILGDSFWPYLVYAAGPVRAYAALASALLALAKHRIQKDHTIPARDFLKEFLIRRLLAGKRVGQIERTAARICAWQKINVPVLAALREHHANSDMIVIASGGLSLYLPEMLRDIPHDALICTNIGIHNGVVTGDMTDGNCVRDVKAARVAAWLAANGPFDQSWAYGNIPHDLPMMMLAKHRIIV